MMHLHPLLFLGGFMFIVPGIYIAIGTTIVDTASGSAPAARDGGQSMAAGPADRRRDPGDPAGDVQLTQ